MCSEVSRVNGRKRFDTSVWQASFSRRRKLEGNLDDFFVETQRRDYHAKDRRANEFRIFFKEDSLVSPLEFRALKEQFQGFNVVQPNLGERGAGTRTAAWIDERSFTDKIRPGLVRTNGKGDLTAQELQNKLTRPVRSSNPYPPTYLTKLE
jgi:hypothetical protein